PYGLVVEFLFDHYPESVDNVEQRLRQNGISSSLIVRREYDDEELFDARFLSLNCDSVVSSLPNTLKRRRIPICSFCGFEEPIWDFQRMQIAELPKGYE